MDRSKRNWILGMEVKAENMAMLHQYYLAGISKEEFSEENRRRAYGLLERIEAVLVQSGFLSETDIRLRHAGVKKLAAVNEDDFVVIPALETKQ